MSLTDPTSKMSKSHELARSRILITDTADDIKAKIASALTDSVPGISYDTVQRPGISNLLSILSIFDKEQRSPDALSKVYRDTRPRVFKEMVSDAVICGLDGIRTRYMNLLADENRYLDHIVAEGSKKARQNAEETMAAVRNAVGF